MRIETDLKIIERLAEERNEVNFEFRAFLKSRDIESHELDSIVYDITKEVTAQIDCTKCGNCCKIVRPVLDNKDISKFAFGLKLKIKEFEDKYITQDKDIDEGKIFYKLPCPFLKNKLCTNYDHRPKDCISFPHLYKEEFISRLLGIIDNYGICPIVFNVYEKLKLELWHFDYNEFDDDSFV